MRKDQIGIVLLSAIGVSAISCIQKEEPPSGYRPSFSAKNEYYPSISKAGIDIVVVPSFVRIESGTVFNSDTYWRKNKGRWLPLEARPELISRFYLSINESLDNETVVYEFCQLLASVIFTTKTIIIDSNSNDDAASLFARRSNSDKAIDFKKTNPPRYSCGTLCFEALDEFGYLWKTEVMFVDVGVVSISHVRK